MSSNPLKEVVKVSRQGKSSRLLDIKSTGLSVIEVFYKMSVFSLKVSPTSFLSSFAMVRKSC